jgi:hypothetical protein
MAFPKLWCASIVLLGATFAGCAPATTPIVDEAEGDGAEPTDSLDAPIKTGTVADAIASSCTTASVKGLSQQIIDEAACVSPGAYALVPQLDNLKLNGNIFPYLEAPARDALVAALQSEPGKTLTVNSMLRTVVQQVLLYKWYQGGKCGIGLAAKPGNSNHETGLAFDTSDYSAWKSGLTKSGFKWFGSADVPHFDYAGSGATSHKGLDIQAFQRLWNRNHADDKISEDGKYGPATEARLLKAPIDGFPIGAECGGSGGSGAGGGDPTTSSSASTGGGSSKVWTPAPGTSWQWVISSTVDTSFPADVYDIDLFDAPSSVVSALHAQGRKAICYVSVGSYEDWRPDAAKFPAKVLGKDYQGWAGEKWLDIRNIAALAPILDARLDLCAQKGFDAVEPDNIAGYDNDTGFPLTAADQIKFNLWIAGEAHARGLSIGLKNDNGQVADLVDTFDWALTESCASDGWCSDLKPFISQGKAVFQCEYTSSGMTLAKFCPQSKAMQFSGLLKGLQLDNTGQACP